MTVDISAAVCYQKRRIVMLKDIKLGFKLLKYSYKLKLNLGMLILFIMIGIVVEIMSKGTSIIGGVYFMLAGLFTYQMIMSMDVSEMVQSTAMKKKIQIHMPVITSTLIYTVMFTFFVFERIILIHNNVADVKQLIYTLFTIDLTMLTVYLFTGICYKYFIVGMLVFMVAFMAVFYGTQTGYYKGFDEIVYSWGLAAVAILGYVIIIAGAAFEVFMGNLLYKKPLSEFAFRGFFRDAK